MKKIENEAKNYAEKQNSAYSNDYYGFIAGANWAIENNLSINGKQLTEDIVKLRELHNKVFSLSGKFDGNDVEEYERLVTKYEGLDLTRIF